jgi:DNA-binding NarL/FixJ family response regulator
MPRILLADDHSIVRRQLREILETEPGFTVCAEASNGIEAITLAASTLPDVVLLDVSMPQLNGLQAAREIHERFPGIEILILTMYDPHELMDEAIALGARTCILKTDPHQLMATVRSCWQQRQSCSDSIPRDQTTETQHSSAGTDAVDHQANALTQFERQIVKMLAEAKSNKEIATTLCVTVKAVEGHREAIMRKLKLASIFDLVQYAIRNKLIASKSTSKPFMKAAR